ncbi:MAG: L-threonylcarbamoyladenylate synthase [Wenzhouxiangellaceae bacterium]|nr:L-threonylcarbamoyladenylate synthase [Wenzhouxiangellaceae bacterium]
MIRLSTGGEDLERAVALLREGRLVGVPTETVYGLAGDASDRDAVRRIFAAKGRPPDHPLIVHLPDTASMADWAAEVPAAARRLADAFWPGPLTLVLRRGERVPGVVTGGQSTVALRVPAHPVTRALLERFGGGLAAPSANRFGRVSPTTAEHVESEFAGDERVAAVIDGGSCEVGVESTIVDCTVEPPRLLRPGMIGMAALEAALGSEVAVATAGQGPRAPGRLASHYAPRTPVAIVESAALESGDPECAVLALEGSPDPGGFAAWKSLPAESAGYARGLYAALRELDSLGAERLLVQRPPDAPEWAAVHDRLERASS